MAVTYVFNPFTGMLDAVYVPSGDGGGGGGGGGGGTGVVSYERKGVGLVGVCDGVNRLFKTPMKFVHDPSVTGRTIEVFQNGRRLAQASSPNVLDGEYYVLESGGMGTGFDAIYFLVPAPTPSTYLISNFVAV